MRSRSRYWSCTKFADWVRGTPKNGAKTSQGWAEWRKQARAKSPWRYWIAEECLDSIQDTLYWPTDKLYDLKYYINNRWVTKTHALTAHPRNIARGTWCDFGDRILYCLFNELVEFVEVELAWKNIAWDKEAREKYKPPYYAWGWARWRTWRCPQAGIDHLKWEMSLTYDDDYTSKDDPHYGQPTSQAVNAKEILELYTWWKEVYPNRPDANDASGWTAYCDSRHARGYDLLDFETKSEDDERMCRETLDKSRKIEEQYQQEDEAMLLRLIRIRNHLWT